jgi:hypothetical protein
MLPIFLFNLQRNCVDVIYNKYNLSVYLEGLKKIAENLREMYETTYGKQCM